MQIYTVYIMFIRYKTQVIAYSDSLINCNDQNMLKKIILKNLQRLSKK